MKKILALTLVLCMALASLPVLAETDLTGTWYLVLTGITCGTFELNADGTSVASFGSGEDLQTRNGTWSAEGEAVSLTFDEESLPLIFNGTNLVLSVDGTAKGEDLLKFSREPGEVSPDEVTAFLSSGALPEGKTKEDMEAAVAQVGLLFMTAVEDAVVEKTYGGTWYLDLVGINCGTFELNSDGTCVATTMADKKLEGTWVAEDDALILTIGEQSLLLAYDGEDLQFFGADDPENLASLLKFTREAGVTADELKAYTADGTVPEGKTKDQMEAVVTQMGLLVLIAGAIY